MKLGAGTARPFRALGLGLHGHVGVLRRARRRRIDPHDPARARSRHHHARHGRYVRQRRQRSARRQGDRRAVATGYSSRPSSASCAKPTIRRSAASTGVRTYVKSACDASLKRLSVDHIDLYYQHRVDRRRSDRRNGRRDERADSRRQSALSGALRSQRRDRAPRRKPSIRSPRVQNEWSLWSRDLEDNGQLEAARELRRRVSSPTARSAAAFLPARSKTPDDFAEDDFRRHSPRFSGENFAKNLELVAHGRSARRDERAAPPRKSRSRGCSRRAKTSFRFPGPNA